MELTIEYMLLAGGMDTRWLSVRPVLGHGVVLSTLGVAIMAGFVRWFATVPWHDSHSFVLVDGSRAPQGYGVLIGSRFRSFKSLIIGSPSGLRPHQGSGLREWPST